jgi:hypothetical protein
MQGAKPMFAFAAPRFAALVAALALTALVLVGPAYAAAPAACAAVTQSSR